MKEYNNKINNNKEIFNKIISYDTDGVMLWHGKRCESVEPTEEEGKEMEDLLSEFRDGDDFVIWSLYGIKTKKITQKNLAKILNCTQSCIAKKHNKILNIIKESLKY